MAYEKQTWTCGEVITADKLNHMEDGIASASEGGSCDCGFSCTEIYASLTEEDVTTTQPEGAPEGMYEGILQGISEDITATSLRITFDGTQYICPRFIGEDGNCYGAPFTYGEQGKEFDWSEYPFVIIYDGTINTQTVGTHTVKIEEIGESIETTECFEKAARKASSPKLYHISMIPSGTQSVSPQQRIQHFRNFDYTVVDASGNELDFATLDYDAIMLENFHAHGLVIEDCNINQMSFYNPSDSQSFTIMSTNVGVHWVAIKL